MVSFKQQSSVALAMLAGALLISILMYWSRPSAELAAPIYRPVSVDAALVTQQNLRIPIEAQGTVAPLRATLIQAERYLGVLLKPQKHFWWVGLLQLVM